MAVVTTKRSFGRLVAVVALMSMIAAACNSFDNMYPTANTSWSCTDGSIGDGFCRTDNSTLTVWVGSPTLSPSDVSNIQLALNNSYAATDLSITYQSTPVTSGSAETDIMYEKGSGVPSGNIGMAWCNDAVTSEKCDQHYVRWTTSTSVTRNTACHETGHSVGLTHGANADPMISNTDDRLACMERPSAGGSKYLGTHNTDEINAQY